MFIFAIFYLQKKKPTVFHLCYRYHQVNSKANEQNQNIAVNIWFRHDPKHFPRDCELSEEKASLKNFHFPGMDSLSRGDDNEDDDENDDNEDEDDKNKFPML